MAIDAGEVRARGTFDHSEADKGMDAFVSKIKSGTKAIKDDADKIPSLRPEFDASHFEKGAELTRRSITELTERLIGIPPGKIELDVKDATAAARGLTVVIGDVGAKLGILHTEAAVEGLLKLAGAFAVVVAASAVLIQVGAQYDKLATTIRFRTGAIGSDMAQLRQVMHDTLASVPNEANDVAAALVHLTQGLHITGKDLQTLSTDILKTASRLGADVPATLEATTRAFRAFGVSAKDQKDTFDFLGKISQQTGIHLDELSQKVASLSPYLRQFGLDTKQGAAFIKLLDEAGVDSIQVLSSLRGAFSDAAESGKDTAKEFEKTISVIRNASSDSQANALARALVGPRDAAAFVRVVRAPEFDINKTVEDINKLQAVGDQADAKSEQITKAFRRLQEDIAPLAESFSDFANKVAVGATQGLVLILEGMGKAIDDQLPIFIGKIQEYRDRIIGLMDEIDKRKKQFAEFSRPTQPSFDPFAEIKHQAAFESQTTKTPDVGTLGADGTVTTPDIRAMAEIAAASARAQEEEARAAQEASAAEKSHAETIKDITVLQERLNAARASGNIAEITKAEKELNEAIDKQNNGLVGAALQATNLVKAFALLGGDQSLIEQMLQIKAATQRVNEQLGQLTDKNLVALGAQLLTEAENTDSLSERMEKLAKASELAAGALAHQNEQKSRDTGVISAITPSLSSDVAERVNALVLEGKTAEAAALAIAQLGPAGERAAQGLKGTKVEADESTAALKRMAENSDPDKILSKDIKERADSLFSTLIPGLSAAQEAWLQYRQAQTSSQEALEEFARSAGINTDVINEALRGTAEQAAKAKEDIQAALKFQETGKITPVAKETDAAEQFADAIKKARETLSEAREKMASALEDAQRTLREATARIDEAISRATQEHDRTIAQIGRDRAALAQSAAEGLKAFNQTLAGIETQLSETLTKIARRVKEAREEAEKNAQKAQQSFTETTTDAVEQAHKAAIERAEELANRVGEAWEQNVDRAKQAFKSLSSQLESIRDQQNQLAFTTSQKQQDITLQGLLGSGFEDFQARNKQAMDQLRLNQEAGLASAGLTEQENRARGAFGDALESSRKELEKTLSSLQRDAAKATKEATEALQKTIEQANKQLAEQLKNLQDQLAKVEQQAAAEQEDAQRKAEEARKKAEEEEAKRRAEEQKKNDDLSRREEEADRKLREEIDKQEQERARAREEYDRRQRDIARDMDRTIRQTNEDTRKAREDLERAMTRLERVLGKGNELLQAAVARMGLQQRFEFPNLVIQETAVDVLEEGVTSLEERLRVPVG